MAYLCLAPLHQVAHHVRKGELGEMAVRFLDMAWAVRELASVRHSFDVR